MQSDSASEILKLEQAAMERWSSGDPEGFLELSAEDVTYFDPFTERRLNGRDELAKLYRSLTGQVKVDRYEFIDPKVELMEDMAVLTFNFVSYMGRNVNRWNTTEVYRKSNGSWKIIHTHWAFTRPRLAEK